MDTSTPPDSKAPIVPPRPCGPMHFHGASDMAGPQPGTHQLEQRGLKTGTLTVAWAVPRSPGLDSQPWKDHTMSSRPVRGGTRAGPQQGAWPTVSSHKGQRTSCRRLCLVPRLLSLHHAGPRVRVSVATSAPSCAFYLLREPESLWPMLRGPEAWPRRAVWDRQPL